MNDPEHQAAGLAKHLEQSGIGDRFHVMSCFRFRPLCLILIAPLTVPDTFDIVYVNVFSKPVPQITPVPRVGMMEICALWHATIFLIR